MILVLAVVGGLGYFGLQALELGETDRPVTPSVGYPGVGGGGPSEVGDATNGVLGN